MQKLNKTQYDVIIEYFKIQKLIFHLNKQLKLTKPQLSDYKILKNLLYFKRSKFICRQDDMNSFLLFK